MEQANKYAAAPNKSRRKPPPFVLTAKLDPRMDRAAEQIRNARRVLIVVPDENAGFRWLDGIPGRQRFLLGKGGINEDAEIIAAPARRLRSWSTACRLAEFGFDLTVLTAPGVVVDDDPRWGEVLDMRH